MAGVAKTAGENPAETAPAEARKRARELAAEILRHERLYYNEGRPEITDAEFDALMRELLALEEKDPDLPTPDSPARRVGGAPAGGFAAVPHAIPMLSLENAYSWEEAEGWLARPSRLLETEPPACLAELKIDGLSISLKYEGGVLVRGATRGDGYRGDDVTQNVRTIRSIPLAIDEKSALEVRGEIFYPRKAFEKLNAARESEGLPLFANPRNAAAGTMKLLDSRVTARRGLAAWLYAIVEASPLPASQTETLDRLRRLGFRVNPHSRRCESFEEVRAFVEEWRGEKGGGGVRAGRGAHQVGA